MRKIALFILLCLVFPGAARAGDNVMSEDEFREKAFSAIFRQAAGNLQENRKLYLKLLEKVDGATGTGWRVFLGRELVSQPVAVIEILAAAPGVNIESVCPPLFFEDTPDYVIDEWTVNAVESLSAFRMTDPAKESVRQECLRSIVQANKEYLESLKK